MSQPMHYVTYYVAPQTKVGIKRKEVGIQLTTSSPLETGLQDFCARHEGASILGSYTEILDSKRTAKWPELHKAIECCQQNNATLLIVELGTLANNDSFTQILLGTAIPFHCIDQPFVDQNILAALSKHAEIQRKLHGKLIREGLKMTSAKSGNPKAAEVIGRVNKPKIDTAIVFAFLLDPIIQDYRKKGSSQRQMVKALNDEGFTAPEGGKWVLSQLQKVLDRVRLNEIATDLKTTLANFEPTTTLLDIAESLNNKAVPPFKQPAWDGSQVKKLCDRIEQIRDITFVNGFVLNLLPVLHEFRHRALTPIEMLTAFQQAGMPIKQEELLAKTVMQTHSTESNPHIRDLLSQLKNLLNVQPNHTGYLELTFDSASKHMPVYLKIVKSHIEQLAKVLELETHQHRNLENAGLAEPVVQLIKLFSELKNEDIEMLEQLAEEARDWQYPTHAPFTPQKAETIVQEA